MATKQKIRVDLYGYLVGPGDFCICKYGGFGHQLMRVHHWMSNSRARCWKFSNQRQRWSSLVTVDRALFTGKIINVGDYARAILAAPKDERWF